MARTTKLLMQPTFFAAEAHLISGNFEYALDYLMALSHDCAPQFTTLAKFVRELCSEIRIIHPSPHDLRRPRLIGRQMFAIDGVKLLSNASKTARKTRLGKI